MTQAVWNNQIQNLKKAGHASLGLVLKLGYCLTLIFIFLFLGFYLTRFLANLGKSRLPENLLFETRYQTASWKVFGEVFEPIVELPVYQPASGYTKEKFLLDSGALVSSLPREKAPDLGYPSLAFLPRITFTGFGNTASFAYKAGLKVKLGDTEVELPVVFTEAAGTKPILGRLGFFENYSVLFNSREKKIEIRN